jgi:glycerate 2-kinase
MSSLSHQARSIFAETMRHVDVRSAVHRHLHCDASTLTLGDQTIPLSGLDQILILAIGKAAGPMYQAAHEALHSLTHLPRLAVVIAPQPPPDPLPGAAFYRGPHPTPDADTLHAADAALGLLRRVTPRTAVLFLISGGASAMMERPLDPQISLEDLASFNRALVGSGLPIAQMNALRKHLSAVKGGRLAQLAAPARHQCTLLISDVAAADPDAIGSGPTLPDSTTLAECHALLAKLHATTTLPPSITSFFSSPRCVETPKITAPAFRRAHWQVILSSDDLAQAAAAAARALGFHTEIDNACDEWEYRKAARYLLDRSAALQRQHPRTCLITAGEIQVSLPPNLSGEGGRNQQFALWCAAELARRNQHATVLSAGSDGVDGQSTAAGAVCDPDTLRRAHLLGLSVEDALARFNTSPLLRALAADIVTGPSSNNLRDLRLLLTAPESPSPQHPKIERHDPCA